MRKSFTQLFGFLLLSVMMLFSSGIYAQEVQQTVEVYAESVPAACYNVSNSYPAKISVRDFIGIKSFTLVLKYNAAIFTAGSASTFGDGSVLTGVATDVTEVGSVGTVTITWSNATAVTIGDNAKRDILSVPFTIDGYPNNAGTNSFHSDLTWDAATKFYYDEATASPRTPVFTTEKFAGSVDVNVAYASLTPSDYSLGVVDCNGGTATLQILNPAPAAGMQYQFNGAAWQTSASASVLAGTNTVRIQNTTSGCISHLFTVNVTEPTPLDVTPVTTTDAVCYGENGEVVFNFSGGSSPYAFYAVPSGNYSDLLATVTSVKTATGLADYYYPNSVIGLPAGTYSVAVTSNGCQSLFTNTGSSWAFTTVWEEVTILPASVISAPVIAKVDNTCNGGNTGSIDVDASALTGGNGGPYSVTIDAGTTWVLASAGIEFTGLTAKDYTVQVKDALGCTTTGTVVSIGQPTSIVFTVGYQDVTCVSATNGVKGKVWIATATGGTGLYDYAVTDQGVAPVAGDWKPVSLGTPDAAFANLDPDYYSVYVRNRNNAVCPYVAYNNLDGSGNVVPIQTPGELEFTTNADGPTDVTCNPGSYTLKVTATGGSGVYTYAFSPLVPLVSPVTGTQGSGVKVNEYTLTNLADDVDIVVTVTDGLGCPITRVATVNVAPVLTLTIIGTETQPTCPGGTDGLVTVQAAGSVGPYQYSVDNINWVSQNDVTITEAATTIWARSSVNTDCKTSIVVDLPNLTPNTLTSSSTNVVCYGGSTGSFTVNATWLTSPSARQIAYYYSTDASKVGTTNVSTGSGVFLIASGVNVLTATKAALPMGTYYVWAVDEYGCSKSLASPVVISQNPALTVSAVKVDATCFGKQDGLITITANAGSGSAIGEGVFHQYAITQNFPSPTAALTWKNFDTYALAPITNVPTSTQLISAGKGTYYIFVKDASCVTTNIVYTMVEVDGYDNIITTPAVDPVVITGITCNGLNNGTIELLASKVSGGKPGKVSGALYSFTLSNAALSSPAFVSVTNSTGTFSNLRPSASYTLVVTDDAGCNPITFSNLTVADKAVLAVTATVKSHFTCGTSNDGIINFTISGGTAPYRFAVNASPNGTGSDITTWVPLTGTINMKDYVATETGDYVVYVKDANDCVVAKSNVVTIMAPTPLVLTKTVTDVSCNGGTNGIITVAVTGGGWASSTFTTQAYSFTLENPAGTVVATNMTGVFSGLAANDNYVVKVKTTNSPTEVLYPLVDCGAWIATPVTQPIPFKYQVSITNVLCRGEANGTLKVKVLEGGVPSSVWGYKVAYITTLNTTPVWMDTKVTNDPDGDAMSYTFTGLPHAIYTVMIMDANGCVMPVGVNEPDNAEMTYYSQESFEVNQPATALSAYVTFDKNVTCFGGSDGQFTVTADGGSGPGTYMYAAKLSQLPGHLLIASELVASDWQASPVFANASKGTWIIWVKDANGCIVGGEGDGTPVDEWRVRIAQPDEVAFTLATNSARDAEKICFGATTGSVTASIINAGVFSGTAYPYTIKVTGTSAAGATVNRTETITSGTITMTGLPATETAHVEPTPAHTTHNAYTVTITNKNGCFKTGTIEVWQDREIVVAPLTITAGFKCPGDNNGFIETFATGGSGNYLYQLWRNGVAFSGWVNISSFAVEVGHNYTVLVKDADASIITPCEKASNTIEIAAPVAITTTLKELTCYDDLTASVKIKAQGNPLRTYKVRHRVVTGEVAGVESFGPYSSWLNMTGDSIVIPGLTFANNLTAAQGLYYFEIMDSEGCNASVIKKAFVPTQHPLQVTPVQATDQLSALMTITGGISPYSYQVGSGAMVTLPVAGNTFQVVELKAPATVVTVYDAHGCMVAKSLTVAPLTVTAVPASGNNQNNEFDVVLTFNRTVTVAAEDITGGTFTPGTGKVFTVSLTGEDLAELSIVLANTIKDAANNALATTTFTYKVGDHVAPTVVVTPPATPVATVFTVGLKFSEPVSGVLGGVTVTGGTLTSVEGLGDEYTLTVSGVEQALVTIVLTDAIKDISANTNAFAGETLTYTIGDFTAPQLVTWTPLEEPIADNHPTFKMTFSENVKIGEGGMLKVYKLATTTPVLEIPITAAMVSGKDVTVTYAPTQTGLDKSTRYYVLVDGLALEDNAGNAFAGVSDVAAWTFRTGSQFLTGVDPSVNVSLFKVYPNPFVDFVNIDASSKLSKVVVTNIAGQVVKQVVNPANRIQLNELRSGIYFISLHTSDNVIAKTVKIVKR